MKRKVIQFFVLLVGVVVLLAAVHFLRFGSLTGFAVFSDSGQGDFDLGTYDNTLWNGSAVVLAGGNLTGNYSSQVFDAGADAVWNNLTYDSTSPNIEFLYGVDGGGDVYQSVNLGVDWTMSKENFGRTTDTEDMFADSVYLYIISNSNKEIWRSEDGESWNVVNNSFVNSALLLGEKDSNENLFAVDGSGDVYLSSDNGINWELKGDFNAGATANAKGIAINSSNDIFIVDGNGDVFLSIDEGENWEKVNDGYGGGTYTDDLEVDSNDNLYILFNSEIYKSINQGVDWSLINEDYEGNQDGLEMLIDSSDNFFIIDPSGDVYKSIDYGLNWSLIGDFNLDASNDVKGFTSFIDESNLTYQVRNCSESDCSDGVWQDADLADLALVGRYFQYKIIFTSPDSSETPFLESIVIDYDVLDSVSPNISFSAETTVEGTYNSDAINVGVDVSDDSQIYSFINFDSSLVSFWKMNDSSGNVLDYSGNGYDGSVTGASYGVNGKFGNAMSFDGSGDYIIFGNINSFERTDEFSYSFWINTDSTTSYITIMSKTPYGSWQGMELFIVNSKLKLYLIGAAEQIEVSSTATVNTGTWRHVVIVCDGSSSASGVDIYVDGVEGSSGSGTLSSSIVNSNNFQISGRAGNYNCFDGLIDEFLVFNRVLTSDEILALYDSNSYSRNFTNLEDGSYDFYSYAQDTAGYENQTETRTVTLVSNTAPSLTLVSPQEGATYGTNESLDLEFSVSDADGNLDSCWYTLDLGETNFSLVGCANTTFDVSGSDSYNLTIYANDTSGLESSDDNSFSVQVGAPSITLISPIDVYLNSQDITFRYTPTDVDLDSCELWGDFDGEFKLNQTDTAPESGNENSFSLTLPDGIYLWNIKCNDTQGHEASNGNKTFYVDTVAPVIKLTQPTGTKTSRENVPLVFSISEPYFGSCWYSVYRGASIEIANTTINCSLGSSSFDVTVDAIFVLNFYANDSAGNSDADSLNFTVDTSSQPPSGNDGGGGGGGGGSYVPNQVERNETSKAGIGFSDLRQTLVKRGTEEKIVLEITNKEKIFLNDCGLLFGGFAGSWLKNSQTNGLSPGEKLMYEINLFVPESIEPGEYEAEVIVQCGEGKSEKILQIIVYRNTFEAEILHYEKVGNQLEVTYLIEEYAGEEHEIVIDYALVDFDGVSRFIGQEIVNLGTKQSIESVIQFDLPKDSFGEFSFEMGLNDGLSEISTSKKIFLPSERGLAGLVISNENRMMLSIFGVVISVLLVLILIVWIVKKFRKKKKKNEILKSRKFSKKKGRKELMEIEL